jgi:hypothetical protein
MAFLVKLTPALACWGKTSLISDCPDAVILAEIEVLDLP